MTTSRVKRIAMLSSGSDNSGINSAIRSVVRCAQLAGVQCYGVRWGYLGLETDEFVPLSSRSVSGKIGKAGCIIGTGRPDRALDEKDVPRVLKNLKDRQIDGLIVIGGHTSLKLSAMLAPQVQIVGIPSTVQDDIVGTDICLGVDSAVNNVVRAIDNIRSCDSSRNRAFLVEVEGRTHGFLAIRAALVSGCEVLLTPEMKDMDLAKISAECVAHAQGGKTQVLCLISKGWQPGIDALTTYLEEREGQSDLTVRKSVLGYIQRGGAPTAFERLLGLQLGVKAFEVLQAGGTKRMVGLQGNAVIDLPYEDSVMLDKPPMAYEKDLFALTCT